MSHISQLYKSSLALLTDLYQLTMAQGYWKSDIFYSEAVFHLFFRKNPFRGGYAVACGMNTVKELIRNFKFAEDDIEYLSTLKGNDDEKLFDPAFLGALRNMEFSCSIDAVPEGTIVFPHEPLLRIQGPLYQCQLLETMLLNTINFETLIATKAARICQAARGDPVLEFGLRRAQGIDGAISASRAAYIGGCAATSNVLAGKLFGIPVKGTHAHSWIMCFEDELTSFNAYAKAMPNNCVFLVDTYDTIEGVKNAIRAGESLRANGYKMMGIRLDSGDLAMLSIEARKLLDDAGFEDAIIVASNDLDEYIIESLKHQGAKIGMWGVGTKLATAYDQPALGGVYKLSAIKHNGTWKNKVKLSEQPEKTSIPGILQVWRIYSRAGKHASGDVIFDAREPSSLHGEFTATDVLDGTKQRKYTPEKHMSFRALLQPLFTAGDPVQTMTSVDQIRDKVRSNLEEFDSGIKCRFIYPHCYPVGIVQPLYERRKEMILKAREGKD